MICGCCCGSETMWFGNMYENIDQIHGDIDSDLLISGILKITDLWSS